VRWLPVLLVLLLPLAWSYHLGDYTGNKPVYVLPGKEVNLVLPFPEGNNCLPVAVLWVEGGKDYPVINVNGQEVVGSGVHRLVLRGDRVIISMRSSGFATLESNSLFYCTRDPFVFLDYYPPDPILFGNYNYGAIILSNAGYSDANVTIEAAFHRDLAPFSPIRKFVVVPARSRVSYSIFFLAAPFLLSPSAHPRICISYRDSVMTVKDCKGPIPAHFAMRPLIKCVENECIDASNLKFEVNGWAILPGDRLTEGDLAELSDLNSDIRKISLISESGKFEAHPERIGWIFLLVGLVFAVVAYVAFK